jgi:two-component system, NarL family, sensor histidine kinase UhpB
MKFRFILLCSFLQFGISAASQPRTSRSDSIEIFKLIAQADNFSEKGQYDSVYMVAIEAAKLASDKRFYKGKGWALVRVAEVLIEKRDLLKGEEIVLEINKIANQVNDTLLTGISILQRGQIKMYSNQPDQAILILDKSIRTGLGLFPNEYLALAYNELGHAWGMKEEFANQADFTHKALSIYEKLGNDRGIAMTLGNLSTVYYSWDKRIKQSNMESNR